MAELWDPEGRPIQASIEWLESSGPVSPRFQYSIHLLVKTDHGDVQVTCEQRNASGTTFRSGTLTKESYESLWKVLLTLLPLGTRLDLSSGLRGRKGISFNSVDLLLGDAAARLDYVLSQADEVGGDPNVCAIVGAIKTALLPVL